MDHVCQPTSTCSIWCSAVLSARPRSARSAISRRYWYQMRQSHTWKVRIRPVRQNEPHSLWCIGALRTKVPHAKSPGLSGWYAIAAFSRAPEVSCKRLVVHGACANPSPPEARRTNAAWLRALLSPSTSSTRPHESLLYVAVSQLLQIVAPISFLPR